MSVNERISTLKQRHTALSARVEDEMARPLPDEGILHTLKRQKLAIKDEITRLELR